MRQLVILSGKGGTGKTTVASAMIRLSKAQAYADCDVDAPNLALVTPPSERKETAAYYDLGKALINPAACIGCGICADHCRFYAIVPGPVYQVEPLRCEGCGVCVRICPQQAITMVPQQEGYWFQSETASGNFFHAELFPGRENSGKLVTLIKQFAKMDAHENNADLIVIDGPPGIGCPVISACAGTDMGLLITEPGQAGLHDLQRVLGTLQHFKIPTIICINKADLYPQGTEEIKAYAQEHGIEIIGEIPFDESIPKSMINGVSITELYPDSPAAIAIEKIWDEVLMQFIKEEA